MSLALTDPGPNLPARVARLVPKLRALAERRVYFGTSSWKYDGWLGQIDSPKRYEYRGKVAKKPVEDNCLTEYAETFPTVCGDFAFYRQAPVSDRGGDQ